MKGPFWLAALGAACIANAAPAATIIQFDSEQGASRGFQGFDTGLGTLNAVTLAIDLVKTRAWSVSAPVGSTAVATIGWTIDGDWRFASDNPALGNPLVALTGTGTSVVPLAGTSGDVAFGFFQVTARGSARYQFDPAQFIGRDTRVDGFDLGYNTGSGDTRFTGVPRNGQVIQLEEGCTVTNGNPASAPESLCGSANYTLTYDYTPAVPEPATWTMMIAGFAATGAALRRRRPRAVAA